jgi:predicted nucleic acid-binding protein
VDAALLERAWKIQDRYQLSFWDAMIVSAAKASSCQYLLTEDLQSGQLIDGVTVISLFAASPNEIALSE